MIPTGALVALLLAQGASPDATSRPRFSQRGFVENRTVFYPQSAANDSGHVVSEMLVRWEASYDVSPWLSLRGSFDARTDTHRQDARRWTLDVDGQNTARPALSARRMSAILHRGRFTAEVGRQFIRWGRADVLNPTDRFAPKDYLSGIADTDFLGVNAARVTWEAGSNTFDVVWQPHFTPTRTPLFSQRWNPVPPIPGVTVVDQGARYPGGSQVGMRWDHVASRYEYSFSFLQGYQFLPTFDVTTTLTPTGATAGVTRSYPTLRMYGADTAIPLSWFTVKGEAAYITSSTPGAEEYGLYVVQVERFIGEWSLVGGYSGAVITRHAASPYQFAADRGLSKSVVGRAAYTIDVNRSFAIAGLIRTTGSLVRFEYSQTYGQHWRTTAAFAWMRGTMADFLGQYAKNSYGSLAVRYSF